MFTRRSPLTCKMLPWQPLAFSVPVPLAISTPLQKKSYWPVLALTKTKLPVLVSSWRQKLNTVTLKLQLDWLLEVSVAVQVTVVVPTPNTDPPGGLHANVTPGQLSLTIGLANVTALPAAIGHEAAAVVLKSAGQVIEGACVSTTVTVNVHMLPDWAVQVTVVTPLLNVEPLGGLQLTGPQSPLEVGAL